MEKRKTDPYTPAEKAVLDHLVGAWNAFVELKPVHDDHQAEFRHAIHAAQNIVGVRALGREYPEAWAGTADVELEAARKKYIGKRWLHFTSLRPLTGLICKVERSETRGMVAGHFVCCDGRYWRLADSLVPTKRLYCENEGCDESVVHAEHWDDPPYRLWCEKHTLWSGHFEHCHEPCERLLERLMAELEEVVP